MIFSIIYPENGKHAILQEKNTNFLIKNPMIRFTSREDKDPIFELIFTYDDYIYKSNFIQINLEPIDTETTNILQSIEALFSA